MSSAELPLEGGEYIAHVGGARRELAAPVQLGEGVPSVGIPLEGAYLQGGILFKSVGESSARGPELAQEGLPGKRLVWTARSGLSDPWVFAAVNPRALTIA